MEKIICLGFSDHFDAAHLLRGYSGPCANLHGHRWKIDVEVCGKLADLDETGILIDYKVLKSILKDILPDHCFLNDIPEFQVAKNPTAENLAVYLYAKLSDALPSNVNLILVRIWESRNAYAVYQPGKA